MSIRRNKKALAISPRYPAALSNLASVYYNQRDFGQAERVYKQALSYEPNQAVILANLGAAYLADAKYKRGMDAYLRALALDPNILHPDRRLIIDDGSSQHAPVYDYYLAQVCATAGKTKEAISYPGISAAHARRQHGP